ncbi:MAG TPA: hypothetical protein VK110_05525 [Salinisphaeraceae bacterium]|nr:hypothetical protein [Salinisphaeraceae bacterium]
MTVALTIVASYAAGVLAGIAVGLQLAKPQKCNHMELSTSDNHIQLRRDAVRQLIQRQEVMASMAGDAAMVEARLRQMREASNRMARQLSRLR